MSIPDSVQTLLSRIDDWLRRDAAFCERPRFERFSRVRFNPYTEGSPEWSQYEANSKAEDDHLIERENLDRECQSLIEAAASAYIDANATTRSTIRQFSRERPTFVIYVWEFARYCAEQIVWPEDHTWLRIGLAAMAIEDCRFDSRDETVALGMLYFSAGLAGIDPEPHFQEIAGMCDEEMARAMRAGRGCSSAMGDDNRSHLRALHKRKQVRR